MFVAYFVPKQDTHLVVEDGIGMMAKGATEAEAVANLKAAFVSDEQSWDDLCEWHALHTAEFP